MRMELSWSAKIHGSIYVGNYTVGAFTKVYTFTMSTQLYYKEIKHRSLMYNAMYFF